MKTKVFLLICLIFCKLSFFNYLYSQTIITTNITSNTTWTITGSPYWIQNNITLTSGDTLTIEPGVLIKFNNNRQILVSGNIIAIGTLSNPITFTSIDDDDHGGDTNNNGSLTLPSAGDWRFVQIGSSSTGGGFQHCNFYYGGGSAGGSLQIFADNYSVLDCEFGNSMSHTGFAKAIHSNTSVSNLTFSGGDYVGILLLPGDKTTGTFTLSKIPNYSYIINDDISKTSPNFNLYLEEGIILKYNNVPLSHINLVIGGNLTAIGTNANPIIFTSINDDVHGGDTNGDGNMTLPLSGDWDEITVNDSCIMTHCEFWYGGGANTITAGMLNLTHTGTLDNCHFEESKSKIGPSITLNANPIMTNITFGSKDFTGVNLVPALGSSSGDINLVRYNNLPFLIADFTLDIQTDINLIIQPGTIFKAFGNLSKVNISGSLNANGTRYNPIVFTSIKDDKHGGDTNRDGSASNPKLGDWAYWRVNEVANSASFKHCQFLYGGRISQDDVGALQCLSNNVEVIQCSFFENAIPLSISLKVHPDIDSIELRNNRFNAIGIEQLQYNDNGFFSLEKYKYPFLVASQNGITTQPNFNVNIHPGVVIKIANLSKGFNFIGNIQAIGSADSPIIFTSAQDDSFDGDTNRDGNASSPDASDWDAIVCTNDSSTFKYCYFRYAQNGLLIDKNGGLAQLNHCAFEYNTIGVFSNRGAGVNIDSSFFKYNNNGVSNSSQFQGALAIHNCMFSKNRIFDIENLNASEVDARFNQLDIATLDELLEYLEGSITNLEHIYDINDNPSKGLVNLENMIFPNGIAKINPSTAIQAFQDTISISIKGYKFEPGSTMFLCKERASIVLSINTTIIDTLNLEAMVEIDSIEPGLYDVCVINPSGDTLILENGLGVYDTSEYLINQWIPFQVTKGDAFSGTVFIPNTDNLFVLLKKGDRISYASSWKGMVNINQDGLDLSQVEGELDYQITGGEQTDLDLHIKDAEEGVYTFEVETLNEQGKGQILFSDKLPTLALGQWSLGEILRPYGYDWWQFDISNNVDTLFLRTEGYGLWSTIEVFYEKININSQKWLFNNWGNGYQINGAIPSPPAGRYYIRYKDSAVLIGDDGKYANDEEQRREYLIRADITQIPSSPGLPLSITGISIDTVGHGLVTFDIFGTGFSSIDSILLKQGDSILIPQYKTLKNDLQTWTVSFDLTDALSGQWDIFMLNNSTSIVSDSKLIVVEERFVSIDINVIARPQIRAGRWNAVIVEVANLGNISAIGVPVFIAITSELEPEIRFSSEFQDFRKLIQDSVLNDINWSFYSDVSSWAGIPLYVDSLDSLTLERTRLISIFIPEISPNDKVIIEFELKYNDFGQLNFEIFTGFPMIHPDSLTFSHRVNESSNQESSDCSSEDNKCVQTVLALALDLTLEILDVSAAKECGFGIYTTLFDIFINSRDAKQGGGDISKLESGWNFADLLANMMSTTIACAQFGTNAIPAAKLIKILSIFSKISSSVHTIADCRDAINCHQDNDKPRKLKSHLKFPVISINSSTPEDKFGLPGVENQPDLPVAEQEHFIPNTEEFEYRVDYWNKPDASAPAVEVFIRDTVESDFDLASFEFTEIGFLRWRIPVSGQYLNVNVDMRPDFDLIVNIQATLDPITREIYWVHRALDPLTLDLPYDPLAGYLPPVDSAWYNLGWVKYRIKPNPDLPDNTVFTNQAHVNFDGIGPWGPAPPYGPFVNTFDLAKPVSEVTSLVFDTTSGNLIVSWSGSDGNGSGIETYSIYVSEDTSEYRLWLDTTSTSALFQVGSGKKYCFYSVARDRVFNIEESPLNADTCITFCDVQSIYYADNDLDGFGNPNDSLLSCIVPVNYVINNLDCNDEDENINPQALEIPNNGIDENCDGLDTITAVNEPSMLNITVFPNPTHDFIMVYCNLQKDISWRLFNSLGIMLDSEMSKTGERGEKISLKRYPDGIYLLQVFVEGENEMRSIKVLKK